MINHCLIIRILQSDFALQKAQALLVLQNLSHWFFLKGRKGLVAQFQIYDFNEVVIAGDHPVSGVVQKMNQSLNILLQGGYPKDRSSEPSCEQKRCRQSLKWRLHNIQGQKA